MTAVPIGLRRFGRFTRLAPRPAALPNLTSVKDRIREYYGDWVDEHGRHRFSPDSRWARDVARVNERALRFVTRRLASGPRRPAIVLDVDDTALTTYEFLANTDFGPRQNREVLPAVESTRELAGFAHGRGVAVFFITERRTARYDDTLENLAAAGFPPPTDLYLRAVDAPYPPYLREPGCPTDHYKSGARAYIESLGHTILVNVGDQHSDLRGGHAEQAFKVPNPLYHIP